MHNEHHIYTHIHTRQGRVIIIITTPRVFRDTSLYLSLSLAPIGATYRGQHAFNRNTHPIGGPYVCTSVPFRSRIVMLMVDNANPITPFG